MDFIKDVAREDVYSKRDGRFRQWLGTGQLNSICDYIIAVDYFLPIKNCFVTYVHFFIREKNDSNRVDGKLSLFLNSPINIFTMILPLNLACRLH